ncbi:MAG: DUF58 domain-containing protein [Clostridiales bacterium]|jgi:uncharacterized protein (DUF58 family)|nr:DUF58 domain-containing protein [Clostridiales bacterium]MBR5358345.1 DUF58 domain-containing protein [Clostridiales bacterium]
MMNALLIVIGVIIIVFILEVVYYRRHALDDLSLRVDFSKNVANYGEDIELIEVAENKKSLPLPFVILKFETPREIRFYDSSIVTASDYNYREDMLTMKAHSKHTRRIKVKCRKRGYYVFPRVGITTSDLFLIDHYTKEFDNHSELVVLPEVISSDLIEMLMSVTMSDAQCRRSVLTDPFALAGIREYGPGDPMKSINWKASAKTGELMVNQNASTCMKKVHIFVNLEEYDPKASTSLLEKSISLAYSYLIELACLGIPSSIYTNGIDIITGQPEMSEFDPGIGTLNARAMMLAKIDLTKKAQPFEEMVSKYLPMIDMNDFILFISPQYTDTFQTTLVDIKRRCPAIHWLMPCYNTTPAVSVLPSLAGSYTRWGGGYER